MKSFKLGKSGLRQHSLKWGMLVLECFAAVALVGISRAQAKAENVLIIHSYHPELSWTQQSKQGIDKAFQKRRPDTKVFHEYLDSKRMPALNHGQHFLDLVRKKYEAVPIDVLMVADDPGLNLILPLRDRVFPKVPIVFMGINHVQPKLFTVRSRILKGAKELMAYLSKDRADAPEVNSQSSLK